MKRFNRITGVILSVTIILGLISSYPVLVGAEEVFPGGLSLEDDSDIVFDEAVG